MMPCFQVLIFVAPPSPYDWRGDKITVAMSTVCFDLRYLLNHQTEKPTDEMFYSNKHTSFSPFAATLNLPTY